MKAIGRGGQGGAANGSAASRAAHKINTPMRGDARSPGPGLGRGVVIVS